jgi:hypothetical protein
LLNETASSGERLSTVSRPTSAPETIGPSRFFQFIHTLFRALHDNPAKAFPSGGAFIRRRKEKRKRKGDRHGGDAKNALD